MPIRKNPLPGFSRLWDLVIKDSKSKLISRRPAEVQILIDEMSGIRDADAAVQRGARRVSELRLRVPNRKSLEAGVAYHLSVTKIANVTTFATHFSRLRMDQRDGRQADMTIDLWSIYLSAHVDAANSFVGGALGNVIGEDNTTRQFRNELRQWRKIRKRNLDNQRSSVAHASPVFVRGIDEDHLWEPMVLLDLAQADVLPWITQTEQEGSNKSFNSRKRALREVSARLVAEADQWCNGAADLIISKLSRS